MLKLTKNDFLERDSSVGVSEVTALSVTFNSFATVPHMLGQILLEGNPRPPSFSLLAFIAN